jgi:hypothetical protein
LSRCGLNQLKTRHRKLTSCFGHSTQLLHDKTLRQIALKHYANNSESNRPSIRPGGARKLKARLEMLQANVVWPAASTFGNILSRAGLTSPQKKTKRTTPCSEPFSLVTGPNQLWCMDFKGYFVTGDGKRGDPFTITDAHSCSFDRFVAQYFRVIWRTVGLGRAVGRTASFCAGKDSPASSQVVDSA